MWGRSPREEQGEGPGAPGHVVLESFKPSTLPTVPSMKRLPTSGLLLISLLLPFGPSAVEAAAGPDDELGEQPALLPDWSLLDWHLD